MKFQMRPACLLLPIVFAAFAVPTSAQESSPLGVYGKTSTYCGSGPIQKDITTVPKFGCFVLSPGHSAKGKFSGHEIEVSVGPTGMETFKADGTLVVLTVDRTKRLSASTNLGFVRPSGGSGYAICLEGNSGCPSDINVFSRNPDKTVLFSVSECAPPDYHVCAITQENWDFVISHPNRFR